MPQIVVSNASSLKKQLQKNITQDTTFLLEGGNYSNLHLNGGSYAALSKSNKHTVTFKNANDKDPAILQNFKLTDVANVTLDGVHFVYAQKPLSQVNKTTTELVRITNTDNVEFTDTTFTGGISSGITKKSPTTGLAYDENGQGAGLGLRAVNATDLTVRNNKFQDLWKAGVFNASHDTGGNNYDNLVISRNEITGLTSDGLGFWNIHGATVSENYFHDFQRNTLSDQHADMIQIFVNSGGNIKPSKNIRIEDNVFDSGTKPKNFDTVKYTHTILVDHTTTSGSAIHSNILIDDNWIKNSHKNAIKALGVNNLTVTNNTLLKNEATTPSQAQAQAFQDVKNGKAASMKVFDLSLNVAGSATEHGNVLSNSPSTKNLANFQSEVNAIVSLLGITGSSSSGGGTGGGTGGGASGGSGGSTGGNTGGGSGGTSGGGGSKPPSGGFDLSSYTPTKGLVGTSGRDLITGGNGDDRIKGNGGADYIDAGGGNDWWVAGGGGADVFAFGTGSGGLAIAKGDWKDGVDLIHLTGGLTYADLTYDAKWSASRADVKYWTDTGDFLVIRNTSADQITAADFI